MQDETPKNQALCALVADDQDEVRKELAAMLNSLGCPADEAPGVRHALARLGSDYFDMVFLNVRMDNMAGMDVLGRIKSRNIQTRVILLAGPGEPDSLVASVARDAADCLTLPLDRQKVSRTLARVRGDLLPMDGLVASGKALQAGPDRILIGSSEPMALLFQRILKVAATDAAVLLTGEPGTGKELAARAIHHASGRAGGEFVAVDCQALDESLLEAGLFGVAQNPHKGGHPAPGRFETASGGTFFFDEISNLSVDLQARLVRLIQNHEFHPLRSETPVPADLRIMVASNRDLKNAVIRNRFREDLFYRIQVIPIHLPPLRERKGDIPVLAGYFLGRAARKLGRDEPEIPDETLDLISAYPWPGNVLELKTAMEWALLPGEIKALSPDRLPSVIRGEKPAAAGFPDPPVSLKDLEADYIRHILRVTGGGIQKAAAILGINRKTLSLKMKKYGL